MINEWTLYWVSRLDYFHGLSVAFIVMGGMGAVILSVPFFVDSDLITELDDVTKKFRKIILKVIIVLSTICVIGIGVKVFVPTSAEMAAIKVIPAIVNSDFVQKELPAESKELYNLAKEYLRNKVLR